MACHTVRLKGHAAIVCDGRRQKRKCRVCKRVATKLCDWKLEGGKTCDAPLCEGHTHCPAPGKDLCPKHAQLYRARPQRSLPLKERTRGADGCAVDWTQPPYYERGILHLVLPGEQGHQIADEERARRRCEYMQLTRAKMRR